MTLTADDIVPNHYAGRYEYKCGGLWLTFDHLAPSTRGLDAWVEARWTDKVPRPKMLHVGRMDVMGSRTVSAIVRSVKEGVPSEPSDWQDIVNSCVLDLVRDHLEGPQPTDLTGKVDRSSKPPWVLYPLIGSTGSTSLIAPGGSTKSFLALAAALSVAQNQFKYLQMKPRRVGPVAYVDYEADAETHDARIAGLAAGLDLPLPKKGELLYFAATTALYRVAAALAKRFAQEGVVLAVVDSVMLARGGDAWGSESTTNFYSALRELAVPTFVIDHKSREAIRRGWKGAYGSVVNDNTARLQWEIMAVEPQGPSRLLLKMEQVKRNNVGQMKPIAFDARFESDQEHYLTRATFRQIDPATVEVLVSDTATVADLVLSEVRMAGAEGVTAQQLAELLDKSDSQMRNALANLLQGGQVTMRTEGRGNRWYFAGADEQEVAPF